MVVDVAFAHVGGFVAQVQLAFNLVGNAGKGGFHARDALRHAFHESTFTGSPFRDAGAQQLDHHLQFLALVVHRLGQEGLAHRRCAQASDALQGADLPARIFNDLAELRVAQLHGNGGQLRLDRVERRLQLWIVDVISEQLQHLQEVGAGPLEHGHQLV